MVRDRLGRPCAEWGGCLHLGARTVLCKNAPLEKMTSTVRRLFVGLPVLGRLARDEMLDEWRRCREADDVLRDRFARLTHREREVLGALVDGHGVHDIAASDVVSEATVRTQVEVDPGQARGLLAARGCRSGSPDGLARQRSDALAQMQAGNGRVVPVCLVDQVRTPGGQVAGQRGRGRTLMSGMVAVRRQVEHVQDRRGRGLRAAQSPAS